MSPQKDRPTPSQQPTIYTWFYRFIGLELLIYVLDSLRQVNWAVTSIRFALAVKVISLSAVAMLMFWCGQQCREAKD